MVGNVVNTGAETVELLQNLYAAGDTVVIKYRTGATVELCEAEAWIAYTVPFVSSGYVQVRIEYISSGSNVIVNGTIDDVSAVELP
jgi:hypothetical protein